MALALGLLGLFTVVLGWRAALAGVDAVRGLTFARPGVASQPVPAARADPGLQARIQTSAALAGGTVGVVVRDLQTGALAEINANRVFRSASLFKLPIMVEVLKQQRLKRISLDDELEIEPDQWTDGSGVLQARVGERLQVRELLRLMIQESDNIAALVLLDAVGAANVNATMDAMGLRDTRVRDRRTDPNLAHVTTARDMARLLETIATGRLIDAETSEEALKLLELKQANAWLGEGLPWWVKLAHKWGDLPGARHDAGIVYTPRTTYVAVVLTEGGRPEGAQRVIAEASRAAYEYLGG